MIGKMLCYLGIHDWHITDAIPCYRSIYWGWKCSRCNETKIEWGKRHQHYKSELHRLFGIRR